jgi:anti-anti-sigma factor
MPPEIPVFAAPVSWTSDLVPFVEGAIRGLLGDRGTRLVVDLEATGFIASAALTTLIRLGKRLSEAGGALALARPRPVVVKLLRTVGLTSVLPSFSRLDEAIAFASMARGAGARR